MIYAAVLCDKVIDKNDFINIVAHNKDFQGMQFKGSIDLAEAKSTDGTLKQYVLRLKDEKIQSPDVTFVVMFNTNLTESRSLAEYQFVLNRHSQQIQTFLDDLCDTLETDEVDTQVIANGNLAYIIKEGNLSNLDKLFAKSYRNKMKMV